MYAHATEAKKHAKKIEAGVHVWCIQFCQQKSLFSEYTPFCSGK